MLFGMLALENYCKTFASLPFRHPKEGQGAIFNKCPFLMTV
jgi:hypothetical protein